MLVTEIIGNIGQDAQVKDYNGRKFVSFSVADSYKSKDQTVHTTWVSCTIEGDGGNLTQYLKKGTSVFVRGRSRINLYQRRDGSYGADLSIAVRDIHLLSSRKDDQAENEDDKPF